MNRIPRGKRFPMVLATAFRVLRFPIRRLRGLVRRPALNARTPAPRRPPQSPHPARPANGAQPPAHARLSRATSPQRPAGVSR